MAKRRKNRTHVKEATEESDGNPKSFVIKHGQVGSSLAQLVRDLRKVMEPHTASRLKERKRNKLKDYLTLAPTLHVTHLLALTISNVAPSFRMIRLSSGPTLTFRIERYSLIKDIMNSKKRARSMGLEYLTPPLLVLASFPPPSPTTPPHLPLLMKSFQSLFPSLSPQTLSLSSARRIVLVSYNPDRGTVDFRHFLITVKPYGVSRRVRKVLEGASATTTKTTTSNSITGLLDLGREQDIADFLLRRKGEPGPDGDGYDSAASSASSAAGDDDADAISLADDYVGRNNKKGQRKAVRLDEIGPRMELRLMKITEGVPGKEGAVMYHSFVKKTKAEAKQQQKTHAERERLRKERREEQERNVARKKEAVKNGDGKEEGDGESNEEDEEDDEGAWDEEEEISEGDESQSDASESEADEPPKPPRKRGKKR